MSGPSIDAPKAGDRAWFYRRGLRTLSQIIGAESPEATTQTRELHRWPAVLTRVEVRQNVVFADLVYFTSEGADVARAVELVFEPRGGGFMLEQRDRELERLLRRNEELERHVAMLEQRVERMAEQLAEK